MCRIGLVDDSAGNVCSVPPQKIFHCPGEPHLCQANLVKIILNTFTSPPLGREGDVPREVWNDRDVAQTLVLGWRPARGGHVAGGSLGNCSYELWPVSVAP